MPAVKKKKIDTSPPLIDLSYWEERKVGIYQDEEPTIIKAKVLGHMAVHPVAQGDDQGKYAVTHVLTGLKIVWVNSEEDAFRVGEYLWGKCCLAFCEKTQAGVNTALDKSPWVKPWCREMRKQLKWIDPKPYIDYAKGQ